MLGPSQAQLCCPKVAPGCWHHSIATGQNLGLFMSHHQGNLHPLEFPLRKSPVSSRPHPEEAWRISEVLLLHSGMMASESQQHACPAASDALSCTFWNSFVFFHQNQCLLSQHNSQCHSLQCSVGKKIEESRARAAQSFTKWPGVEAGTRCQRSQFGL